MIDIRLTDGTWVTSPIWAGEFWEAKAACVSEEHCWEAQGDPRQPEEPGEVPIQMERCSLCGWARVRYLENPHPEI